VAPAASGFICNAGLLSNPSGVLAGSLLRWALSWRGLVGKIGEI